MDLAEEEDAMRAIEDLDGLQIDGRGIVVKASLWGRDRDGGGRGGGRGRGGRGGRDGGGRGRGRGDRD